MAQQEKHLKESVVKNVRVYQSGAQVERQLTANLDAGTTTLFVEGLSSSIDANSISVSGSGDASVMGIAYQLDYLTGERKPAEIVRLEDSLMLLNLDLEKLNALEQVNNDEISLLNANKSVSGANVGVDIDMLKEVAEYYRTRMIELKVKMIDVHSQQKKIIEQQDRLKRQLAELNAKNNQPQGTIVITMAAKQSSRVNLKVSYYTSGASWMPAYDIRATSLNAPIQLQYKALVSQQSGESWDNVHLVLSTGNPSIGGTKPVLNTWFLDYYYPIPVQSMNKGAYRERMDAPAAMSQGVVMNDVQIGSNQQYVSVQDAALSTDFDISIPYTIRADGKSVSVDVQSHDLPAVFTYYSVPKLDKDAFLLARVSGWEDLNLLPGDAKIYFEGNYVGTSSIDPSATSDSLDLSLGRDKRIMISRELRKEFSQVKNVGGNTVKESIYEITVRSNLKVPARLVLEDQFPVSKNSEIKVTPGDYSGGQYDESTGKVTWHMDLAAGTTEKRSIGFSVKSPKGKPVQNF